MLLYPSFDGEREHEDAFHDWAHHKSLIPLASGSSEPQVRSTKFSLPLPLRMRQRGAIVYQDLLRPPVGAFNFWIFASFVAGIAALITVLELSSVYGF